jgi:hypothetical protein
VRKQLSIATAGLLACATPAGAQFGLRAAEGTTSLLHGGNDYTVLAVDTKDESLNLVYRTGLFGRRHEWFNQAKFSLSAAGGERDLFAGGEFVPGVRIQNRIAWSDFGADLDVNDAAQDETVVGTTGFLTLFGSFAYEMKSNSLAREGGAGGGELVLDDHVGHTVSVGGGLNWARDVTGAWWGLSADVKWGWGVPVSSRTSEVCRTQSTAQVGGQPAVVSRCEARYFGGVHDDTGAHLRLDWQSPYLPRITEARVQAVTAGERQKVQTARDSVHLRNDELAAVEQRRDAAVDALEAAWRALAADGSNAAHVQALAAAQVGAEAAAADVRAANIRLQQAQQVLDEADADLDERREKVTSRNTVTVLASLSSDLSEGEGPRYNVAVGPMLHPGLKPLNVVGALLFEVSDITDSSAWRDRFSVRLYLGLPFGGGGIR